MTDVNGITGRMASTASSFLELQLLGAPQLRLNAQSLHPVLTGKPLALLLYLAVTGQPHTRDVLATMLWSELSIQQARNNLRYVLPILRRVVAPYLQVTTQTISFNRQAPYRLDVEIVRTTLQGNLSAITAVQLQTTLEMYQGEFLAGFRVRNAPAFVAWLTAQRQQLHTLMLQGLLHLAEHQLAHHDHAASQLTRQRLRALTIHPSSDLLTVLTQAGIDLAHYQPLIPWLKTGETQLSGLQASAGQLYTDDTAGQPAAVKIATTQADRPPDSSADEHDNLLNRLMNSFLCHNLPSQLTPFFGRQQEMSEILAHLAKATYRLLTLTGEGGIGKTRLALALAQSIVDCELQPAAFTDDQAQVMPSAFLCNLQFQDGIWFVPLAHLVATTDLPNQLATTIAKAIQLPLTDQDTPTAQLIHYFVDKRSLLILDNFEQVSAGTDFILELLQATTALKLLITSRHRLNIQAEYPWRLTGLSIPSRTSSLTMLLAAPQEYAGIALFVERARRAYPGFQLTADNLPAIIQICHFVQGLPLGLELAAALTKDYTCTEVWEILRHNYHILTTTLPDLPARHRTIKVVLDHSWRFLSAEEARVLAGCSIFCGTFEREAAIAVTGTAPAILARLIDQSLLHWTAEAAGRRWLNLHELVRQYAAEQLAAVPYNKQQVQAAHAAYYMAQLQQIEALLQQNTPVPQFTQSDLANIRAAWLWSSEKLEWTLLEQGLAGLTRLYRLTGLYQEAVYLLQATLTAMRQALRSLGEKHPYDSLFAHLLTSRAEFCGYLGWLEEGEQLAQEALEWGQRLADVAGQSRAYYALAHLAQRRGQHLRMRTLAEQASTLAQQTQVPHLATKSLTMLGAAELLCGKLTQSNDAYYAALRYLHEAPDPELEAVVRMNLGAGHLSCHDYAMARRYLAQAFVINQSLNTPYKNGAIYVVSGLLWATVGAYEQAQQGYQQAVTIFKEVYEPYWESWVRVALVHLLKQRGKVADALQEGERVLPLVQGRMPMLEHCTLTYLGDIRYHQGDWTASEQCYRQALQLEQQAPLPLRLAEPTVQLAHLLLQRNEAALALALLEKPLLALRQEGLRALAEPFAAYWTGYQVFKANADPRADAILQEAYQRLLAKAAQLDEPALHQSFLEVVQVNRLIRDAGHAAGLGIPAEVLIREYELVKESR